MSDGLGGLLHDATVLHGFVDFIEEYCREQKRSQTYVDASGLFFGYAEKLAIGIKQELCNEIERANKFPARIPILRRNILTLKYYLRLLHTLIKPAGDAHTLTIPAPLIELAARQLHLVEGMKDSQIVILLTPELMYFQRPHTEIKNQARLVESFIPQVSFPLRLGFIELPYSQGPSFFTNLAIYHEIGHFVFEELGNVSPPHAAIAALRSATLQSLNKVFGPGRKDLQVFAYGRKILESWTQEIFCDLFALRLLGPAFSFALIEMLGMLGFLSRAASVKFTPTHPASACRFAEHVRLLKDGSWLEEIDDVKAEQKAVLERLASIPKTSYKFYFDDRNPGPRSLVDTFLDSVIPAIRALATAVTTKATASVKQFRLHRPDIEKYLGVGVVPSMDPADTRDAVAIINSAFCFYLTSLPDVIVKFEGAAAENDVAVHSRWAKRLEMWTLKAIEDSQVLDRYRKVQRYGPF